MVVAVPGLDDYRYRLLTYHQPLELYPGMLSNPVGTLITINDEEHFISTIKEFLASERVKRIIGSLLSQVMAA